MAAPGTVSGEALEKATHMKALIDEKMEQRRRELEEKRRRREVFAETLADPTLTEDDRRRLVEEFEKQERAHSIEMRKRYSKDDFEALAVVGKGAFGEVRGGTWGEGELASGNRQLGGGGGGVHSHVRWQVRRARDRRLPHAAPTHHPRPL
jgi:hypothetical protein